MAKQTGDIKIKGEIDGISFYKLDGDYYARQKSGLTGKRFWRDKVFEGSRRSCRRMGEGSRIASEVYMGIPKGRRKYEVYCMLKSKAIGLLKEEKSQAEVVLALMGMVRKRNKKKPDDCRKRMLAVGKEVNGNICRHFGKERASPSIPLRRRGTVDACFRRVASPSIPLRRRGTVENVFRRVGLTLYPSPGGEGRSRMFFEEFIVWGKWVNGGSMFLV